MTVPSSSPYDPFDPVASTDRISHKAAKRAQRREAKTLRETAHHVQPLKAKTPMQQEYIDCLDDNDSALVLGPAGVGKTYIAGRKAAQRLVKGEIDKIVVSRVTVSKKEHALGFLPGNIEAKMKPWLIPVIEGIRAEVSSSTFEKWKAEGKFEIVPFEYMRGRTFDNSVIILDEAQNAALDDLKLILTRTGTDSQMVVCGDPDQVDIPNSGLEDVADLADRFDIMAIIEFTEEDVVRSKFAKDWVKAFATLKRENERASNLDKSAANLHSARH